MAAHMHLHVVLVCLHDCLHTYTQLHVDNSIVCTCMNVCISACWQPCCVHVKFTHWKLEGLHCTCIWYVLHTSPRVHTLDFKSNSGQTKPAYKHTVHTLDFKSNSGQTKPAYIQSILWTSSPTRARQNLHTNTKSILLIWFGCLFIWSWLCVFWYPILVSADADLLGKPASLTGLHQNLLDWGLEHDHGTWPIHHH